MVDNVRDAQHSNGHKPNQRDRPEKPANICRAAFLNRKQAEQDDQRERNDSGLEGRRNNLQALNCRQNRNRRCDDAIAVKQAGTEDTQGQESPSQYGAVLHRLGCQSEHGHQAALAIVVRTQHESDVLERNNDGQRPEENRKDAVDIVRCEWHVAVSKYFLDSIQHAGADIAVNNANGAKRECRKGGF